MKTTHYNFDAVKFTKRMGLIILVLYVLFIVLSLRGQFISNAESVTAYSTHIVSEGETLWQIAADVKSDEDIRNIVYEIKLANDMSSTRLDIGQALKIPMDKN